MQIDEKKPVFTPEKVIASLKKGNKRFVSGTRKKRNLPEEVKNSANRQTPKVIILNCSDSRIPVELIYDQGMSDIFNVRIAGNIINDDIMGSIEFAAKNMNIGLIIVMGHTNCGAVAGACEYVKLGKITGLVNKIVPAMLEIEAEEKFHTDSEEFYDAVSLRHVELTVKNITRQSYILNEMNIKKQISIVGAMYDVKTGKVDFLN